MAIRSSVTLESVMLVILGVGMATFVTLHSIALLQSAGEQTLTTFRGLWFLGIGLVAILLVVARFRE